MYNIRLPGGSVQRQESSNATGHVVGMYSIREDNGRFRTVSYVADKGGFRAQILTNEPGGMNLSFPANFNPLAEVTSPRMPSASGPQSAETTTIAASAQPSNESSLASAPSSMDDGGGLTTSTAGLVMNGINATNEVFNHSASDENGSSSPSPPEMMIDSQQTTEPTQATDAITSTRSSGAPEMLFNQTTASSLPSSEGSSTPSQETTSTSSSLNPSETITPSTPAESLTTASGSTEPITTSESGLSTAGEQETTTASAATSSAEPPSGTTNDQLPSAPSTSTLISLSESTTMSEEPSTSTEPTSTLVNLHEGDVSSSESGALALNSTAPALGPDVDNNPNTTTESTDMMTTAISEDLPETKATLDGNSTAAGALHAPPAHPDLPGVYSYQYEINVRGGKIYREEASDENGRITGSYVFEATNSSRRVNYTADASGGVRMVN